MKIVRKAAACIILTGIWLILNEKLDIQAVVLGIAISILCIWLSGLLLRFDYTEAFSLSPISTLKYAIILVKEVYVAGIKATVNILRGDIAPCIVQITMDPRIKHPFLRSIVANSITLTPGTITIEQSGGELTVLCLTPEDSEAPSEKFENLAIPMKKEG